MNINAHRIDGKNKKKYRGTLHPSLRAGLKVGGEMMLKVLKLHKNKEEKLKM